jgi:transcription termination factor Rho
MSVDSGTMERSALSAKVLPELQRIAEGLGVQGHQRLRKGDLIDAILAKSGNGDAPSGSPKTTAEGPAATSEAAEATRAEARVEVPAAEGSRRGDANGEARRADRSREADAPRAQDGEQPADRDEGSGEGGSGPEARASDSESQASGSTGQQRTDAPTQERPSGPGGPGRQGGGQGDGRPFDRGPRDRRPSRDERRRQREQRRQREIEEREEEIANAPTRTGILDVLPEGYGFLRCSGYLPGPEDVYASLSQIRRFALRKGDRITGQIRMPRDNEKYPALLRIDTVNDVDPEVARGRAEFDKLTPLFPDDRFRLEHVDGQKAISERIIDLVSPIGKGQRGMVVSPPKAGKTTILKQIAGGILASSPDTHLIILLVDERPEEVTDWQRTVPASEVVYSTFDKPADQHTQVTELVLERAKRLVEMGRDVAILLDSITRLARAYNLSAPASGRILSGGVDSTALYPPKRFFGAARNIEEGGSLTIIASALVETGSRMDEVIFEEFKGTGNMEVRLDRALADKRMFPAINIDASGTRKEERLMDSTELALVWRLRRVLTALEPAAALELLVDKIRATKSNQQFLQEISKAPVGS